MDWQKTIGDVLNTGLGLFQAANKPATPAPAAKPQPQQTPPWVKWAAIGGAALAGVLVIVALFRKR